VTAYGDEGWTWGTINHLPDEPDKWLTVWGSHWHAPVLNPTQASAEAAFKKWLADTSLDPAQFTVRRVRMVYHAGVGSGRAFRILPVCGHDGYVCEDCAVRGGYAMDTCYRRSKAGARDTHREDKP
jgi:hypothetical protein